MLQIIEKRNHQLIEYARNLSALLSAASVPGELASCKDVVLHGCQQVEQIAQRNLLLIEIRAEMASQIRLHPQADFTKEILQGTHQATLLTQQVSAFYAPAIIRATEEDRLSLHILGWLHRAHKQTQDVPPVVVNHSVAVLPLTIPIYHLPIVEQRGLLYQPLSFHEYGHVLYDHHADEMDDLVSELRAEILDYLSPDWHRDDRFDEELAAENQAIADTWYSWIQELFCDAVGFQIGGPAYFYAFTHFLSSFAESDFHRLPHHLRNSEHPVRWLRVRFLQARARQVGFSELADQIGNEWDTLARAMQVEEDYYGYYDPALDEAIGETLACMLEEASPRPFTEAEAMADAWNPSTDTAIHLLNWAWRQYLRDKTKYPGLEKRAITELLSRPEGIDGNAARLRSSENSGIGLSL